MAQFWLTAEDLLMYMGEHTAVSARVRDAGVLVAVAARPQAVLAGIEAYPTAVEQAAALLHGIARWRPLTVWNSGLAWAALRSHLGSRGLALVLPARQRIELTERLTAGDLDSVSELATELAPFLVRAAV